MGIIGTYLSYRILRRFGLEEVSSLSRIRFRRDLKLLLIGEVILVGTLLVHLAAGWYGSHVLVTAGEAGGLVFFGTLIYFLHDLEVMAE